MMSIILRATFLPRQNLSIYKTSCTKSIALNHLNNIKKCIFSTTAIDDKRGKTIYLGPLTKQVYRIKIISLVSSGLGLLAQPFLLKKVTQMDNMTIALPGLVFITLFALGTPLLLHFVTKSYVTRIDYDIKEDSYIAYRYSIFASETKTKFKPEDVTVPDIAGIFTTCHIKGKSAFFVDNSFSDIDHYKRIMGYDKPIEMYMQALRNDKEQLSFEKLKNMDNSTGLPKLKSSETQNDK
ncbi:transmembrane protein 70 homolog, mitochondrial isoform X2 [Prorops nasuta]|uniref:transmembrane protein 70 homolog, mitochondrial isoform X2 n=1 Tax=Prorops nasuta TaxID=863751 RepID=UPI0034CED9F9